ncbi:hypothetical protein [Nocardioides campestrisoli]|uniref:hypothetical protein n=1 Tax=Nocardioides campestrisoli TaxID=2736757 RepID=UPI0015E723CB|nr:hypothetical protein [Nocardioides campestrisoli]
MRHVRAALVATTAALSAPALLGAVAVAAEDDTRVFVQSTGLVGTSSLMSWFGAAPEPTFAVTLRNGGELPVTPTVQLEWRDGDGPATAVVVPEVGELAPGDSTTLEVPVQWGAFAQGEHIVRGVVRVGDDETALQESATVAPWGLYGLGVVALLAGVALRTRWVLDQDDDEAGAPLAGPEVEAQALATIHRFSADREESAQEAAFNVPSQRAPQGGRRATEKPKEPRSHRGGQRWLTRR